MKRALDETIRQIEVHTRRRLMGNPLVEQDGKMVATLLGIEFISPYLKFGFDPVERKAPAMIILGLSSPDHVRIKVEGKSLFRLIFFNRYWVRIIKFEASVVGVFDSECRLRILGPVSLGVVSKRIFNKETVKLR